MTAPIRNMAEIRQALVSAKIERGISFATLDHISGLPDGYSSKVLAPNPVKMVGNQSLGEILQALGKALVMVDDEQAIAQVKDRWRKSKRPQKEAPATFSIAEVLAAKAQIEARKQIAPSMLPEMQNSPINVEDLIKNALKTRMREIGMKGNKSEKRKAKMMARRARQAKASHAARRRWAKRDQG